MRSASIGTPAALQSSRPEGDEPRAGFTLLEALVALAVVLAFASALGPYMFQARRIVAGAESRVAAQVLLRTLLDAPFDRAHLVNASRAGEAGGLRWRIDTEPLVITADAVRDRPAWAAFRVVATVAWGRGQVISAETVRLGKPE
jgi:prepilin-type N-terminal cleavage/methylation domain-containing protein